MDFCCYDFFKGLQSRKYVLVQARLGNDKFNKANLKMKLYCTVQNRNSVFVMYLKKIS